MLFIIFKINSDRLRWSGRHGASDALQQIGRHGRPQSVQFDQGRRLNRSRVLLQDDRCVLVKAAIKNLDRIIFVPVEKERRIIFITCSQLFFAIIIRTAFTYPLKVLHFPILLVIALLMFYKLRGRCPIFQSVHKDNRIK